MFYVQYHLAKILYLTFLCLLVFNRGVYALPCGGDVRVGADKKEIVNDIVRYQGDVEIKSGSLVIKSDELSIKNEQAGSIVVDVYKAKFDIYSDNKIIRGYSDNVVFYAGECILDLIGNSRIISDKVYEYNNVRYFLNEGLIKPLWLYIDQGRQVVPKKRWVRNREVD